MKKLFLSLLACATVAVAQAQPGSILAFGNVGIATHKDSLKKPTHYIDFNINPGVGYQFNKNWTAGIYFGYNSSSFKPDGGKRTNTSNTSIGMFGRYTCPISPIFAFFAQAQVGYVTGNTKFDGNEITGTRYRGVQADVAPAIAVYIKKGFALNFGFGGMGFRSTKLDDQPSATDYASQDFYFTFGQQFNIGVSKNFGGRHHHARKGRHGMMDDTRRMDSSDDNEDDAPKKKRHHRDDDDE